MRKVCNILFLRSTLEKLPDRYFYMPKIVICNVVNPTVGLCGTERLLIIRLSNGTFLIYFFVLVYNNDVTNVGTLTSIK